MSRWIEHWNPEDNEFWERQGKGIARRNLIFSILAEHLGFSVWLLWSVVAVKLADAGFEFSAGQLFTLVAVPALVGATVRFPYTFAVPRFGGRNWTVVSALLLLVPTLALALSVRNPETPYWALVVAAAAAGLGGGNFASSMANISFFYPERAKGLALGLNAAGGNIGVSVVQLVVPILIGVSLFGPLGGGPQGEGNLFLQNAGLVWVPFILVAAVCAWLFMDNLATARSTFAEQARIVGRKHTWIMSWLYIGTFGSFIGYSAGLPLLIAMQFPEVDPARYAFLGPLVGSLARPVGGALADRLGGARVTLWNFVTMILAVLGVLVFLDARTEPYAFAGFMTMFLVLFTTAGIGNGSTFRMIPAIFRVEALRSAAGQDGEGLEQAAAAGRTQSAAVLGFTSAIGAYGGFFVPQAYGLSAEATGGVEAALYAFIAFYVSCVELTWWYYLRRRVASTTAPSLAAARV
jgi:NNP family nitrate/nitrite transporter-like MFS transporter